MYFRPKNSCEQEIFQEQKFFAYFPDFREQKPCNLEYTIDNR
jgi:hypothetical protein